MLHPERLPKAVEQQFTQLEVCRLQALSAQQVSMLNASLVFCSLTEQAGAVGLLPDS